MSVHISTILRFIVIVLVTFDLALQNATLTSQSKVGINLHRNVLRLLKNIKLKEPTLLSSGLST